MRLVLFLVLILLLFGGLPTWHYSQNWGYFPAGIIGLLLVVFIVATLLQLA